jgi:hypothetical protein
VSEPKANGSVGAPARSRTKTDQDAIYMQVTRAQADVIRAKADREGKSIKDVLLTGLMDRLELETELALVRARCADFESALADVQAMLLGAATERALTREEAQIAMTANKLLKR